MAPTVIAFAPGRVELLGNHTDYNDGVALAAAIDRGVTIRAEKLDADLVEISSEANGREVRVSLKNLQRLDEERWANYPIGVIKTLREAGFEIGGMRLRDAKQQNDERQRTHRHELRSFLSFSQYSSRFLISRSKPRSAGS